MNFRKLELKDYINFIELINDFRITNFTLNQFTNFILQESNTIIYVLEDNKKLYASGTIIFEKKFIHNFSIYSHIEDIIVKKEYQGKGLGKILLEKLIKICKKEKVFKILLDCETKLIPFYEKCGFIDKGHQMVIYI